MARKNTISQAAFLENVPNKAYREALQALLEFCRGLQLTCEWGTAGMSIRFPISRGIEPLSVGWLFPTEGGSYWYGLSGLNFGYDPVSAATRFPSLVPVLERYTATIQRIPWVQPVKTSKLHAYQVDAKAAIQHREAITEALAALMQEVNGPMG